MKIEPEISGASVVLVGNFNPAILTPAWFELNGLLPEGTAEGADLHLAHPGTANRIITILEDNFDGPIRRSERIMDHVMSVASDRRG